VSEIPATVEDAAQELAAELLPRIIIAYAAWDAIREYAKQEKARLKEKLAGRIAQLKEAMDVGHATINDQVLKLTVVEQRWQDLEETRAEAKDVSAALTEQIKAAQQKIRDLMAEAKSGQLPLFAMPAQSAGEKETA
jgi:chromosome segregation ATPase